MIKDTLSSLAATAVLVTTCSGADTVAINFLRSSETTPAANDGSEYEINTWEDVLVADSTTTLDGVTVSWDTTGVWNGGGNNVENGYLDNAGSITVSGLSAWLTANSAVSYKIKTVGASDTADNWFGDTLLREVDGAGILLDTLTNPNLQRGLSSESVDLSADIVFIDPTNVGIAPVGGGGARTSVAGLIITVVPDSVPADVTVLSTKFVGDGGDGVNSELRITVESQAGFNYQILLSPDLTSDFLEVGDRVEATGTSLELTYLFPSGSAPSTFFRVSRTLE